MISFDEAIDRVRGRYGGSRGEAIEFIGQLRKEKDPETEYISNIDSRLSEETGLVPLGAKTALSVFTEPGKVLASAADLLLGTELRSKVEEVSGYLPPGPRIPLLGLPITEAIGGAIGFPLATGPISSLAESGAAALATRGIVAPALKGLERARRAGKTAERLSAAIKSPEEIPGLGRALSGIEAGSEFALEESSGAASAGARGIRQPAPGPSAQEAALAGAARSPSRALASDQVRGLLPDLGRAERLARLGARTGVVAAEGALYTQGISGAILGGGIGALSGGAIGLIRSAFSKRIADSLGNQDVMRGIDFLAKKVFHEDVKITQTRFKTAGELQAALAKAQGPPLDTLSLLKPDEVAGFEEEIKQAQGIMYGGQYARPEIGFGDVPFPKEPVPSAEIFPLEGIQKPKTLRQKSVQEHKSMFEALSGTSLTEEELGEVFPKRAPKLPEGPPFVGKAILDEDTFLRKVDKKVAHGEAEEIFGTPTEGAKALKDLGKTEKAEFPGFLKQDAETGIWTPTKRRNVEPELRAAYDSQQKRWATATDELLKVREKARVHFPNYLPEEEAFLLATGKAKVAFKRRRPLKGFTYSTFDPSRTIFNGHIVNAEVAFDSEPTRVFAKAMQRLGLWTSLRIPTNVMARFPETAEFMSGTLKDMTRLLEQILPQLIKRQQKILERYKIGTEVTFDEWSRALNGLDFLDGKFTQRAADISGNAAQGAEAYWRSVLRPLLWQTHGLRLELKDVLAKHQLPYSEQLLRDLKGIQDLTASGVNVQPIAHPYSVAEIAAAHDARGMLAFDSSYDLSLNPFEGNLFSLFPVHRERVALQGEIGQLIKRLQLDDKGSSPIANAENHWDMIALAFKKARLEQLEKKIAEREAGGTMMGSVLPSKHRYGPYELAEDPDAIPFNFDTDPKRVGERLIVGFLNKRYYDSILHRGKMAHDSLVDRDAKAYLINWINGVRGAKGFNEDANLRQFTKLFQKHGLDEEEIREVFSNILKLNGFIKLTISPRFSILNSTQTMVTVPGFVGFNTYARALARVLKDSVSVMGVGKKDIFNNSWMRAKRAGVLEEAADRFITESESFGDSILNTISKYYPFAYTAKVSEQFNRTVAFEAFRMSALEPGFKPHKAILTYLKTLKPGEKMSAKDAVEYGQEGVRATQFILSKEGRPTAFIGGQGRRLLGQFRTYSIAYTSMMKNLWTHDKVGFMKNLGGLLMLGGPAAVPFYRTLRSQMMRAGVVLPDNNGFTFVGNQIYPGGLNFDIDMTEAIKPIDLPMSASQIPSYVLGPTFGPTYNTFESAWKEGPLSSQTVRTALRGFSPFILSGGEAISAISKGGVFDRDGTLRAKPSSGEIVARAAGLRPTFRDEYYRSKEMISDAIRYGHPDLISHIVGEARKKGVFITYKDISQIRGQVKRDKKRAEEPIFR